MKKLDIDLIDEKQDSLSIATQRVLP